MACFYPVFILHHLDDIMFYVNIKTLHWDGHICSFPIKMIGPEVCLQHICLQGDTLRATVLRNLWDSSAGT